MGGTQQQLKLHPQWQCSYCQLLLFQQLVLQPTSHSSSGLLDTTMAVSSSASPIVIASHHVQTPTLGKKQELEMALGTLLQPV
ncbi:hypothetical protein FRX31_003654 [Thalictrum thalictroides]|uniref:Uncharacterized protein n=1 Tax=Thalictrum thalictroides TaxID=46969 RepID=A0A7J6XAV3_THATH|nr:hypothetical protein FRX31_003654 [Thalictrum thalictroides]